jgi:hypothetical protein
VQSKRRKGIPAETLLAPRRRLDTLSPRHPERKAAIFGVAELFNVSPATIYRALREFHKPKTTARSDNGKPRILPASQMEKYCSLVAALKMRTTNKQNRHLSTRACIAILEEHGVETPQGLVKLPKGALSRATVDRYLRQHQLDQPRLKQHLPAVRFQAEYSNDCWHFDLSPSDLKHLDMPVWADKSRKRPQLMLFSVVDDRSGVCYQEYRCVYGEDMESGLRFLFNAMSGGIEGLPFKGIPKMLYLDNGPIARSLVFQRVMDSLGVSLQTHMPASKDKRRTTARSKGKVERAFRTVKDAHETLYHFHKPETEEEANQWLQRFLINYNHQPHRSEKHSRLDDWLGNLPRDGIRDMCTWESYCTFAREPERRKVGIDARIAVDGTVYEVDSVLAGETVVLWWGVFDLELYVECEDERFGPYTPVDGPIPLHRYRTFKKTTRDEKFCKIELLAKQLCLPKSALTGNNDTVLLPLPDNEPVKSQPFTTAYQEVSFKNPVEAKLAISALLNTPLAKLSEQDREFIEALLDQTLERTRVLQQVREYYEQNHTQQGENGYAG